MGAFHSGALTVQITLNHLYPMTGAKTRIFGLLPVRGTSFTAVVGHLEARVLLGSYINMLFLKTLETCALMDGYNQRVTS